MATECGGCLGGAGEAGLPLLFIMALIVLGLFTVIGIFYSVLVATMVGQRIWQRHYHILAKRMLTKVCLVYLLHLLRIWCIAIVCWFFAATQLINQASFIPMIFAISPFSCHFIYEEKIY
jgi:hypothetical protein